jgi:hypothetical protein
MNPSRCLLFLLVALELRPLGAAYNPQDPPYVSHDAGKQLVIEYIEQYWSPTTTSADLLRAFAH